MLICEIHPYGSTYLVFVFKTAYALQAKFSFCYFDNGLVRLLTLTT